MKKGKFLRTLIVALALIAAICIEPVFSPFKGVEASTNRVTVKSEDLAKAKTNIKLYFNGKKLSKKGFLVNANSYGKDGKILYVPVDTLASIANAKVKVKTSKVSISALNIKVTFKKGKNTYTYADGDYTFIKNLGKSYVRDDTIYVPVDVFKTALGLMGFTLKGEVEGKKYNVVLAPIDDISGENDEPDDDVLDGGYSSVDSPDIPAELAAVLEKIKITGVEVTPVALLSKQIVAGTNYKILCRAKMVVPGAKEVYAFATVYVDLAGNVELVDNNLTEVETNIIMEEGLSGGWSQPESVAIDEKYLAMFKKATQQLEGVAYTPKALLATQVVAGVNACVLCEAKGVYPGAKTTYAFVYIYADLTGNATITDIKMVE